MAPPLPNLLFLCTGNSCRSQMAEGWARHLHGDKISAYSAGITAQGLNPLAVRAMQQFGVFIGDHRSKTLDELKPVTFDLVVTVCDNAQARCPGFTGKTRIIHHAFDDPPRLAVSAANEQEALAHYLRVCGEIREWVLTLPRLIGIAESATQDTKQCDLD